MDEHHIDNPEISPRLVSPVEAEDESGLDVNLRPGSLDEFVGQDKLKENLKIFITAANQRKEPLTTSFSADRRGSARRRWPISSRMS